MIRKLVRRMLDIIILDNIYKVIFDFNGCDAKDIPVEIIHTKRRFHLVKG